MVLNFFDGTWKFWHGCAYRIVEDIAMLNLEQRFEDLEKRVKAIEEFLAKLQAPPPMPPHPPPLDTGKSKPKPHPKPKAKAKGKKR